MAALVRAKGAVRLTATMRSQSAQRERLGRSGHVGARGIHEHTEAAQIGGRPVHHPLQSGGVR